MQFSVKVYCLAYATRVIEADSAKAAAAEAALSECQKQEPLAVTFAGFEGETTECVVDPILPTGDLDYDASEIFDI